MKLSTLCAQMIIYDDDQWLEQALEPVLKYCDRVLIMCNTHPFRIDPTKTYDNSAMREKLTKMALEEPKIVVEVGSWATEEDERNAGLDYAKKLGYTYSLIVDTDEVYESKHLSNLTQILENNEQQNQGYGIFHATWKTYWKMKPLCVIEPVESFQPVICVRNVNARFVHLRHVVPLEFGQPSKNNDRGRVLLPPDLVTLHHFSYARTDEFIKRKCEESGHAANGDLMKDWYEKVWLTWKPGDINLHPISGPQYATAVPVKIESLPESLKWLLWDI